MNQNTHHHTYGMKPKTHGVYLTGFFLCLLLTLIPFYLVMHAHNRHQSLLAIALCGLAQFMVQIRCFLRLNTQDIEGKTNTLSLVMVVIVLLIVVGGSLWIMEHLNYNMMH